MEKYIVEFKANSYYYIAESIDEFLLFSIICCKGNKTAANPVNM